MTREIFWLQEPATRRIQLLDPHCGWRCRFISSIAARWAHSVLGRRQVEDKRKLAEAVLPNATLLFTFGVLNAVLTVPITQNSPSQSQGSILPPQPLGIPISPC